MGLFSLENRRLREDLKRECKEDRAKLFSVLPSDQRLSAQAETQQVPSEHQEALFFCVRVAEHWHRLPREVVESPCLEIFRSHLDTVLGNWI